MFVSDFDYHLPENLIAQEPAPERDRSRLLIVDRHRRTLAGTVFESLPLYLQVGDVLVVNNTRVFPARLLGRRIGCSGSTLAEPGALVEIFLVREMAPLLWEVLARPGRALPPGARVEFGEGELTGEIVERSDGGRRVVRFETEEDFNTIVDKLGRTPLPPYIKREADRRLDADRYQTVYASERGAIAAPTAGLHFTPTLLDRIREAGVEIVEITLHVGYGTFQPVRAELVEDHRVETETYTIGEGAAAELNNALSEGRRIIAVGTTTTRALESAAQERISTAEAAHPPSVETIDSRTGGAVRIEAGTASTDLFIYPGFQFGVLSGLVTNFHLPRSSLLMMVSAFAGREFVLEAYRHAVEQEYRFYSYGDAMLIV